MLCDPCNYVFCGNYNIELLVSLNFSCLQSPVRTRTPTTYLDFKMDKGATLSQPVKDGRFFVFQADICDNNNKSDVSKK